MMNRMKEGAALNKNLLFTTIIFTSLLGLTIFSQNLKAQENETLVERGRYLSTVAGCESCHTPFAAQYNNPNMPAEDLRTLSLFERQAKDETLQFAGGRIFDLGPAGVIVTTNITQDPKTGIGGWSNEEIEIALRTGATPDGRQLHPIMPYAAYNQMSDNDMEAIIAYLRTVRSVENDVTALRTASTEGIPPFPMPDGPISTPDPADEIRYGEYLVRNVLGCSDCHTPIDPNSGQPLFDEFLSGGQPYEGPWGIVYAANITPHEETGIGTWNENEIKRALLSGVRQDGRRLILMPWEYYAELTATDADAVTNYLQNGLAPTNREVPAAATSETVTEFVEIPDAPASNNNNTVLIVGILGLLVILTIGGFIVLRKR